MSAVRRTASVGMCVALVSGAAAMPVAADTRSRTTEPGTSQLSDGAQQFLSEGVAEARGTYVSKMTTARAERDNRLAAPRAQRRSALKKADTKAERRKARRVYRRSAQPIVEEYRTIRKVARAERNAEIDEALANYLVKVQPLEMTVATQEYRAAAAIAGDTLSLALASARETFLMDNADERAQLRFDLEDAASNAERVQAWRDYQVASTQDRLAYRRSIAAARETYASALAEAKREFRNATGESVVTLKSLSFTV